MKTTKIQTFGLTAIQTVLSNATDLQTARDSLAFAIGATVGASGVVLKRVKRNEQCKLVIAPDNVQLTVFADIKADEQTVITRKIRKNSKVSITGKLQTFGASAVCLSNCHLVTS
jgi:DNA-binding GntR family transcriptional regulator